MISSSVTTRSSSSLLIGTGYILLAVATARQQQQQQQQQHQQQQQRQQQHQQQRHIHSSVNTPHPQRFRASVGAIIFNRQGKLLCGKRIDLPYWQFPQGGMHPEEDPIEAATREIKEEIGLASDKLTPLTTNHQLTEKFTYHRPMHKDGRPYAGQEQRYVLFHWNGHLSECCLDGTPDDPPEFSEVGWLSWDELVKLAIPSRMFIYARLRNNVPQVIKDYFEKGTVQAIGIELTGSGTTIIPISDNGNIISGFSGYTHTGEYFSKSLRHLNELQGVKIISRLSSHEYDNNSSTTSSGANGQGVNVQGGQQQQPPHNGPRGSSGGGVTSVHHAKSSSENLRPSLDILFTSHPSIYHQGSAGTIIPEIGATTKTVQRCFSSELAREYTEE